MAFIRGSATGSRELADILSECAIGISLQSVLAIADGGSGYAVGDEIRLQGGTFTIRATVEVTSVGGGGAVTGVRVLNAGLYTTAPSNDVVTNSDDGSGCELTCDFDTNGWVRRRAVNVAGAAQSAVVGDGGSGYTAGDVLTLVGGTGNHPGRFRVATVGGGGEVLTVSLEDAGSYTTPPTNDATTTGGTGTGCELTVTYGGSGDREIILEGEGDSGTDEIFVGMLTSVSGPNEQIELAGFTGFNGNLTWENQPGINPGRSGSNGGCFCPMHSLAISFWISVRPRRILFSYVAASFYGSGHIGLLNAFATAGEWPYPLYVSGCVTQNLAPIGSNNEEFGSVASPPGANGNEGAAMLRTADGNWVRVRNTTAAITQATSGAGTWPFLRIDAGPVNPNDDWFNRTAGLASSASAFTGVGTAGTVQHAFNPTPNSAGDLFPRFPATVIRDFTDIFGEIDGVFAINSGDLLLLQNRLAEGTERFTVFGSNRRAGRNDFWAMRED